MKVTYRQKTLLHHLQLLSLGLEVCTIIATFDFVYCGARDRTQCLMLEALYQLNQFPALQYSRHH